MRRRAWSSAPALALLALLLGGCEAARPAAAPASATFAATVPCAADCATLAYRITLFSDRSYWYARSRLAGDGSVLYAFREVGRYAEADGVLTLFGTLDQPERWQRVTDQALRLADGMSGGGAGSSIALVRQSRADREFGPLRLRGMYRRQGLLATLESCESGARYLVAGGEGVAALGLDYSRSVRREGETLLVAVEARFVPPASRRGAAGPLPIMVDAFERSVPGVGCSG